MGWHRSRVLFSSRGCSAHSNLRAQVARPPPEQVARSELRGPATPAPLACPPRTPRVHTTTVETSQLPAFSPALGVVGFSLCPPGRWALAGHHHPSCTHLQGVKCPPGCWGHGDGKATPRRTHLGDGAEWPAGRCGGAWLGPLRVVPIPRAGWPILLGVTGIPAALQLLLLPFFPESPRYLLVQKKNPEAARKGEALLGEVRGLGVGRTGLQRLCSGKAVGPLRRCPPGPLPQP